METYTATKKDMKKNIMQSKIGIKEKNNSVFLQIENQFIKKGSLRETVFDISPNHR